MNVPVGVTTRWGAWVTAILSAITAAAVFAPELQEKLHAAGVPASMTAKAALIIGALLVAGRMAQAALGVMGREQGPGTVVATTGQGDVTVPDGAPQTPPVDASMPGRELTPEEVAALAG